MSEKLARGTKEWHEAVLERQIELLKEEIPGFNVRYMWGWLEKVWWFGAFIIGKTVFLKKSLGPRANQGLVAHDASHILDKQWFGAIRYHLKYIFSKKFRLETEASGYANSFLVASGQGRTQRIVLESYAQMLANKYKIKITVKKAREEIKLHVVDASRDHIPYDAWKRAYDEIKDINSK